MTKTVRRLLQPVTPAYLPELRRWARTWLLARRSRVDADDVVLAMTELVGNSVQHGSGVVVVELSTAGKLLFLQVSDRSDGLPVQPSADVTAEGGRGILLLEQLAARWGVRLRRGGGKTIWCEFAPRTVSRRRGRPVPAPGS